jgi:methionyl-tRNA formyltransferase
MIKELDAGNIIYQKQVEIQPTETYRTLHDKLAKLAYGILHNKINSLFSKNVLSVPQDSNKVTIAQNITRADEKINWNKTVKQVDAQIRGLYDKPIAYTIYDDL